jgi:hypothetical protein
MSYRRRYEREHYVKKKIRRDIYSKLVEFSKREDLGLQELLAKLIKVYERYGGLPQHINKYPIPLSLRVPGRTRHDSVFKTFS